MHLTTPTLHIMKDPIGSKKVIALQHYPNHLRVYDKKISERGQEGRYFNNSMKQQHISSCIKVTAF